MKNDLIGAAVFGAGWVAGEHVAAYQRNPNCRITAVGSRRLESAQKIKDGHNLDCKCYSEFDELLADDSVDVVSITTPNDSHAELGIRAAQAGKHILMEKPIALTSDQARSLSSVVKKQKVKSLVSVVLHWNPLFRMIKKQLSDGACGRLFYAEVDYYHAIGQWYNQFGWNVKKDVGGNSLLSAGCHAVDALLYFLGDEVQDVSSFSTRSDKAPFDQYEYDPTSVTICKFKNGAVGKVGCSLECNSPYMFRILLMGDKGTIKNNQYYGDRYLGTYGHPEIGQGQTGWTTWPTVLPDSGDVSHHPFFGEIDHLIECIISDLEPYPSISDALHCHEICFAAELAAKSNSIIRL